MRSLATCTGELTALGPKIKMEMILVLLCLEGFQNSQIVASSRVFFFVFFFLKSSISANNVYTFYEQCC